MRTFMFTRMDLPLPCQTRLGPGESISSTAEPLLGFVFFQITLSDCRLSVPSTALCPFLDMLRSEIWRTSASLLCCQSTTVTYFYYGILFSENTLILEKLRNPLYFSWFRTSHWYVNFCFKLLKNYFMLGCNGIWVKCAILISEWVFNFHDHMMFPKMILFNFIRLDFPSVAFSLDVGIYFWFLHCISTLDRLITFCWFYISGIYCLLNIIGEIWVSIKVGENLRPSGKCVCFMKQIVLLIIFWNHGNFSIPKGFERLFHESIFLNFF